MMDVGNDDLKFFLSLSDNGRFIEPEQRISSNVASVIMRRHDTVPCEVLDIITSGQDDCSYSGFFWVEKTVLIDETKTIRSGRLISCHDWNEVAVDTISVLYEVGDRNKTTLTDLQRISGEENIIRHTAFVEKMIGK